ncbi:MAG: hypothetical protein OHK0048_08650 [Rhodoferax sp.]
MIYAKRNDKRQIIAVEQLPDGVAPPEGEGWEPIQAADPQLMAFVQSVITEPGKEANPMAPLLASDIALARVLEDLIDLLVDRSMIRFTDFPPAAQAKLLERHNARHALRQLNLLGENSNSGFLDEETL